MNATRRHGLIAATLLLASGTASAAEYCAIPYLYATHIRTACEQYGKGGLSGLYSTNRFIHGLLHDGHKTSTGIAGR
ncbi:MAG: hypothetical protein AB7O21_01575 [Gammaproteobacteria bacterium]